VPSAGRYTLKINLDLLCGWHCIDAVRGALVALDRWVKDGTPAPASRYPRIADGTLVPSVKLNPAIPGLAMAKGPNQKPHLDFGPDIDKQGHHQQGTAGRAQGSVRRFPQTVPPRQSRCSKRSKHFIR
jgi:hypothetical protein